MITLRRAEERHHDWHLNEEVWHTFHPEDHADAFAAGFGALVSLNEARLSPGGGFAGHSACDAEIITYVREGALANEDSLGRSGVVHAGEFQRVTIGLGMRHSETNGSQTDWAHIFQIGLRSAEVELASGYERKRFSAAQRRGGLCMVASPDARRGTLRIHQDALMYSAILDPGQHVVHELPPGRRAWVHLVQGEAVLSDFVLTGGDGAGVTAERAVSLTARQETELLIFDLADPLLEYLS